MPAVPPILDTITGRMSSKGAVLLYGVTNAYPTIPTTFTQFGGVVKIGGPQLKRTGPVDCTELAPQPYPEADPMPVDFGTDTVRNTETYFNTLMAGGQKDAQALSITTHVAKQMMFNIWYWYTRDTYNFWRILFRDGTYFQFWACVAEIPVNIETDKLVEVELSLQPFGRIQYYLSATPLLPVPA